MLKAKSCWKKILELWFHVSPENISNCRDTYFHAHFARNSDLLLDCPPRLILICWHLVWSFWLAFKVHIYFRPVLEEHLFAEICWAITNDLQCCLNLWKICQNFYIKAVRTALTIQLYKRICLPTRPTLSTRSSL